MHDDSDRLKASEDYPLTGWEQRVQDRPHDFAAALVFAALFGLCAGATILALAQASWWAVALGLCAWACAECFWTAVDG